MSATNPLKTNTGFNICALTLQLQVYSLPCVIPGLQRCCGQNVNNLNVIVRKVQEHSIMEVAELEITKTRN